MARKYVAVSRTGSTSTTAGDLSFVLISCSMEVTSGRQYAVFFSGIGSMDVTSTAIQTYLFLGDRGGTGVTGNYLGETLYYLDPTTARTNKIPVGSNQVWRSDTSSIQKFEVRFRQIGGGTNTISDPSLVVLELVSGSETGSSGTGSANFTAISSGSSFTEIRGITLDSGSYYLFGGGAISRIITSPPTIQSSSILTVRLRNSSSATTIPIQIVQSISPSVPSAGYNSYLIFSEVSHSTSTRYTLEMANFETRSTVRNYRSSIFALKKDRFSDSIFTIDTASSTTTSDTLQNKLTLDYTPQSTNYLVLGNWTTLTSHVNTSSISDFTLNGTSSFSSSRLPTHRQTDTAQDTVYLWSGVSAVTTGSSNQWIIKYRASGSGGSVTIKNTEILLLNLDDITPTIRPLSFGYILL